MRCHARQTVAALFVLAALVAPAAVLADGGGAARARAASERCDLADAVPGRAPVQDVREATLCLMNAQRTARGVGRLRAQPALSEAAGRYARQMVRDRFFDHTSPGGSTMVSRIRSTSYLRGVVSWAVGENLAWGSGPMATPRATVQAWMRSASHRANLLDRRFTDVGIGIAQGGPQSLPPGELAATYVTDFGRRQRG
jgi:uncharacterized protein YkwD